MKALVTIFGYSGVVPNTVQCIIDEVKASPSLQWAVASSDALISRARSVVASRFLQTNADVLVMIDHDLVWRPGDVLGLAERAHRETAIVAGLYSKRALRKGFASVLEVGAVHMDVGSDQLRPAKWLASGFTAYPRFAFEKVLKEDRDPLPPCNYFDGHDFRPFFLPFALRVDEGPAVSTPLFHYDYLSEDWAFSERARRCGVKQLIWAKPRLLHIGEFPYSVVTA